MLDLIFLCDPVSLSKNAFEIERFIKILFTFLLYNVVIVHYSHCFLMINLVQYKRTLFVLYIICLVSLFLISFKDFHFIFIIVDILDIVLLFFLISLRALTWLLEFWISELALLIRDMYLLLVDILCFSQIILLLFSVFF